MSVFAVVDTNVLLSALLSKKNDTATVKILCAMMNGKFTPLWHDEIIAEYDEVFHREKFHLQETSIQKVIRTIKIYGKYVFTATMGDVEALMPIDTDEVIFWQVVMAERKNDAFLITGNSKHFPKCGFVLTPAQMIKMFAW